MCKTVKRGYCPEDEKEFNPESVGKLRKAAQDICYLINNGYQIKGASVFVGNHYLLSERQRLALVRSVSSDMNLKNRREKEITGDLQGKTVNIDGFNTIITLEVACSDSLLLKCMDGTIRDLAALRGSYRLIDKTESAIMYIGEELEKSKIDKAIFYLDAPVSNSGKLKQRIVELLSVFHYEVQVNVINNVDSVLEKSDNVITSDAIILDKCISWINLTRRIMEEKKSGYPYVELNLAKRGETLNG